MLETGQVYVLLGTFAAIFVLQKFAAFRQEERAIGYWPGLRTVFNDRWLVPPFRVKWLTPGIQWPFYTNHDDFAKAGWDIITAVNVLPYPKADVYIADPNITKEIIGARARFPKPMEPYALLRVFGTNIVATEGDEWKHQRKIVAPAFSERNNRLVWDETIRIVEDLFQNEWGTNEVVDVNHIMDITVPIALLVIGVAGFGRRISWNEDKIAPAGYTMTFKDALYEVSHRLLWRVMFPEWMLRWGTPTMRNFLRANKELEKYLVEMISARQAATVKDSERRDLFSSLLDANESEEDNAAKLSDEALLGNVFLFLVAGYETTAHTLAYAFILLALYQDEQEAFYQNIKSILRSDENPTYESFNSLSYSLAVMNETLRLFPPVVFIPKVNVEDTTFTTTNAAGEKRTIPVPRNTYISISTPSLHRNPRYWDEPEKFKPARFLGNYNRDAFLPFSGGPRGCIGRGFAETEGVAVLTLIVSRYMVEVREEAQFKGETFEARKKRLLKSVHSLTVYPERAPLVFKRR